MYDLEVVCVEMEVNYFGMLNMMCVFLLVFKLNGGVIINVFLIFVCVVLLFMVLLSVLKVVVFWMMEGVCVEFVLYCVWVIFVLFGLIDMEMSWNVFFLKIVVWEVVDVVLVVLEGGVDEVYMGVMV